MPKAFDGMQAPLLNASVEAPPPMPVAAAYTAPQLVPPPVYEDPADAGADPFTKVLILNGLTDEDMAKLRAEGVATLEIFQSLDDADIEASGIEIGKRREVKLAKDTLSVVAHHAGSLE